jgi:CYTH domain-containing protein
MNVEIERKFLVKGDGYKSLRFKIYRQGYLSTETKHTVRVRTVGRKAFITIKGKRVGISRTEFEYEIPYSDAKEMLEFLCERPIIEKTRYIVKYGELTWEVDEFMGENQGLVIAEVELESEDQKIHLPPWVGEDVSKDPRYANSNLVRNPYKSWPTKN